MRRALVRAIFLLLLQGAAAPAWGLPHRLFLDFDIDGDLWTIHPYAAAVPVSLVIEIGDDPIPAGSMVLFYFELGCYFDPHSMEGRNCATLDCTPEWGTPGVLLGSWLDCPPLAGCWDALLTAQLDPAFAPVPGQRYLLGAIEIGGGGGQECETQSYLVYGDFAGVPVESNPIYLNATSSVTDDPATGAPTWGRVKSLFLEAR